MTEHDNGKNPEVSMEQNGNKKGINTGHIELTERAHVNWNVIRT
jgi:hypothetical protein